MPWSVSRDQFRKTAIFEVNFYLKLRNKFVMQFVRTLLLKWFCILLIRKYSIAFVLPLLAINKKFSMQRVTIHLTGKPFDQPFIFFLAHRFKKDNGMIFMVNKRIRWLWCGLWLSGEREHFNIWYSRIWFRLHGSFGS